MILGCCLFPFWTFDTIAKCLVHQIIGDFRQEFRQAIKGTPLNRIIIDLVFH